MDNFTPIPQSIKPPQNTPAPSATPPAAPTAVTLNVEPVEKKSTPSLKIAVIGIIGAILLLLIGIVVVSQKQSSTAKTYSVVDKENGFRFTNLQGWQKIPPKEGMVLSLATVRKERYIFSFAGVKAIPNNMPEKFIPRMLSDDQTAEMKKICEDMAAEDKIDFIRIEKVTIPNTNSYKCTLEGVGENTGGQILVMEYLLIVKPKVNLIVGTTYQKNLPEEKINVERLMSGFEIIN